MPRPLQPGGPPDQELNTVFSERLALLRGDVEPDPVRGMPDSREILEEGQCLQSRGTPSQNLNEGSPYVLELFRSDVEDQVSAPLATDRVGSDELREEFSQSFFVVSVHSRPPLKV